MKAAGKLLYEVSLAACREHLLVPGVGLSRRSGPQLRSLTPALVSFSPVGAAKKYEAFSSATGIKRSPNNQSLC